MHMSNDNMEIISLVEGDESYDIIVSPEDARRAENDIAFARSLLNNKKIMIRCGIEKARFNTCEEARPVSCEEHLSVQNNLNDPSTSATVVLDLWSEPETRFMLDKHELYLSQIGPMKRFKTKKMMWHQISEDIQNILNILKTPTQVENRYKTVLKRKKKAVENNSQTGRTRQEIPFEEELNKISNSDDSIEPEILRSATSVRYLKEKSPRLKENEISSEEEGASSMPKRRRYISKTEELFRIKQEAKERRHKEKMDLIRELFSSKPFAEK